MTMDELMNCRLADIQLCDETGLQDLKLVKIAADHPLPHRMGQYLDQIGNPYLFRIDDLIVKVSFSGNQDLSSKLAGLLTQ